MIKDENLYVIFVCVEVLRPVNPMGHVERGQFP